MAGLRSKSHTEGHYSAKSPECRSRLFRCRLVALRRQLSLGFGFCFQLKVPGLLLDNLLGKPNFRSTKRVR